MPPSSGLIICFDFGLRNLGLAIGESIAQSARPLGVLSARDGTPNWQEIESLLAEYRPALLIVGLPLDLEGGETEMSVRARKFANRLHGRFGLPVVMQDERFSSKEAKSQRKEQAANHQRRSHRKSKIASLDDVDAEAAALILSSYFATDHKS